MGKGKGSLNVTILALPLPPPPAAVNHLVCCSIIRISKVTCPFRRWLVKERVLLVRHHLRRARFPRFLNPPLDAVVLLARRYTVPNPLQRVQLETLKRHEGRQGGPHHLEHRVAVVQLFAHDAVGRAKRPHAHVLAQLLPRQHHRVERDHVFRVRAVEAERLEVFRHQVPLRLLVVHELEHLRTILGNPRLRDLGD